MSLDENDGGRARDPTIIVPLDFDNPAQALMLAEQLDPGLCRMKVGKELFTRAGPQVVRDLHTMGHQVFLDLKYHDIPNTVAGACAAAADLGVWMLDVHVSGGARMMRAAREATAGSSTLIIGVSVLTSLESQDLVEVGMPRDPQSLVVRWSRLAELNGLDGVVCSPTDLQALRGAVGDGFIRVTPGVRPAGAEAGDQRRVATPYHAVAGGATYLVIGRPITQAPHPVKALTDIVASI